MKNFLDVPNLSGRVGQKNFPAENKFRQIWHLECSIRVPRSEWCRTDFPYYQSQSFSAQGTVGIRETLLCQQAWDTLCAQH